MLPLERSVDEFSTGKQLLFIAITWKKYTVIQDERSIFWEGIVSVIVWKKSSCVHVSNSEWLAR
jgi:hypothetical protein